MTIGRFKGQSPTLGERVFVDPQGLVLGDVELGDDVSIWPMAVVRGDVHHIKIGRSTNIQDNAVVHATHDHAKYSPGGFPTTIGEGVTVGHSAVIHGCSIGDYCLIGMGAIILDGAVLESRAMVGAGSLVAPGKILKEGFLYVGNPAREVRPLSDLELEFLDYSAKHYIELKDEHRAEL